MIRIFNPIWARHNCAYFSISQWNLDKEKNDDVVVEVCSGNKVIGTGTINKKQWIKTARQKEKKIVFRPHEPLVFYYNVMPLTRLETEDDKMREFSKSCL